MRAKESVRDFIGRQLLLNPAAAPGDDDELLLSGVIDSLAVMRLLAHIETGFGIAIPPEDVVIEHFQTVNAIAAYLESRGVATS